MAKIVIGIGTSHSPQLSIRAKDWDHLLKKDQTDPRLDYPALLQKAKPGLAVELTPEKFRERDEACLKAVKDLGDALQKANADIAVVFGDDQQEQFHDENMPMFAIYHGKSLPVVKDNKHRPSGWKDAERQGWAETAPEYETAQELADHLIRSLVDAEFDITRCNKLREEIGVGHAVRKAVESWNSDKRVALIASGGLSHVVIDEEIDAMVIDGLKNKKPEVLFQLPRQKLRGGTSEILNWVALAGAMENRELKYFEYVTTYRSPAATGCG